MDNYKNASGYNKTQQVWGEVCECFIGNNQAWQKAPTTNEMPSERKLVKSI